MGRNLLLNMADHGFAVAGLDMDQEKAGSLQNEAQKDHQIFATVDPESFVKSLESPKAIMLLVSAGSAVDGAIGTLLPLLDEGDIIIDGAIPIFLIPTGGIRSFRQRESTFLVWESQVVRAGPEGAEYDARR